MKLLVNAKESQQVCKKIVSGRTSCLLPVEGGKHIYFGEDSSFTDVEGLHGELKLDEATS